MLNFNQRSFELKSYQAKNKWSDPALYGDRIPITRQTVAIIGYGAIGKHCAEYLTRLGIKKVYAIQRSHQSGQCNFSHAYYVHASQMDTVISKVDHVVSFLPETIKTTHLFNRHFFKQMKKSACFYNFGRGNSVVESDLIQALNNKDIFAAYLDVFKEEPLAKDSPLWGIENLIITPSYFNILSYLL